MTALKRSLILVALLAVAAALLLLLLHGSLSAYRDRRAAGAGATPPSAGRVTFHDGSGAPWATVSFAGGEGGAAAPVTVRADEAGRFDLPPGAAGRGIEARVGPLAAEGTGDPGTSVVLPPAFDLAGLVQAREGRTGVAGARVVCGGVECVTAAGGTFRLESVPAGVLRDGTTAVRVEAPGYAPFRWTLQTDLPGPFYGDLLFLLDAAPEPRLPRRRR